MRNILFITGSLPPMACGVGHYTASLLDHLYSQIENLTVLTAAPSKDLNKDIAVLSAPGWCIRDLPVLVRQCRQAHAEVIHIQYPAVGYGRQLGINLLPWILRMFVRRSHLAITLHEYFGSPPPGRLRNLITILPAQTVIVSNEADRHALPMRLRKKTRIIPIGSSVEVANPDTATATKLVGIKPANYILFFGYAFPSKRLELLIDAMEVLPGKQLILATDLSNKSSYHKLLRDRVDRCNQATGEQRIHIIGFQPPEVIQALLQGSFCFVLPQAMPINTKSSTLVAAIRCGVPVIGTRGKKWENAPLVDRQNALLLGTISGASIAEAIKQLDDRVLYRSLTRHTSQLAAEYSWQKITDLHMHLYEELTNE